MDENTLIPFEMLPDEIQLVYSNPNSLISAKDFGEAVIGFETCLREAARVAGLPFEEICIEPVEVGSIKTVFLYIIKNPYKRIILTDALIGLLVNSLTLIGVYGSGNFGNPTKEMLSVINDKKTLELCNNFDFRKGMQYVANPLDEVIQTVTISVGEKSYEIKCENKYNFFLDNEKEPILPELKDGDFVDLLGEITRINKTTNDLGFRHKGRIISVTPSVNEENIANFHGYLTLNEVRLKGTVVRESVFETPRIIVQSIDDVQNNQQVIFPEVIGE